jgi:hypothetical protein
MATVAALTVAGQGPARAAPLGPQFARPVLLTTDKYAGGYEPSIAVDRFNNIVITAHKQTQTLALSPDNRSATGVRSQSWLWTSRDGTHFTDMPGMTALQEQSAMFGDEGDVTYDDTGHIYFVDTVFTDSTFSRYKATGNGKLALETTRPLGPSGQPVDDRPWIAAHGDGVVLYAANESSYTYPGGRSGDGNAYGDGRYSIYMSYNHGDTFDPLGITLNDSGWCRPAADHRAGSKLLYVVCPNNGDGNGKTGTLWSFVSKDDGRNWSRFRMGAFDQTKPMSWPTIAVGNDGSVYVMYTQGREGGRLHLLTSKDSGRTWVGRDVTPTAGIYHFESFDVAPNGTLGLAYYHRADANSDWFVYAATAAPGQRFVPAKVSTQPIASRSSNAALGDFFEIAFGPDNKLNVAWTARPDDVTSQSLLSSDVYFARQK